MASVVLPGILARVVGFAAAPWIVRWVSRHEAVVLAAGRSLGPRELEIARAVGVRMPQRVRVLAVRKVPMPGPDWLHKLASLFKMPVESPVGICLRYGIYLAHSPANSEFILAHELAHTAQYEKEGGYVGFLRRYVCECLACGYTSAPMEEEANALASKACGACGIRQVT